jgi:pimeloyl-ACP methyl ester carboxylesterase
MDYLYLHGFASGPQSYKGQVLAQRFHALGRTLAIPDLNQGDFTHLTLTRQIQQGLDWMADRPAVTIIGSSFGGLTAAWLAQHPQTQGRVVRLVLLAPAFQFLAQWLPRLGPETVTAWRQSGQMATYHYGDKATRPLDYGFVRDAEQYDEANLTTPVPTLVLHGLRDEVISIQASRDYAKGRPWVTLMELDSDHSLGDVEAEIWAAIHSFLNTPHPLS